jgi:F-type H+-transporting ATPase subunit b
MSNKTHKWGLGAAAAAAVTLAAPALALAGEGGHDDGVTKMAIFHAINLIALVGVVVYFVRKPLGEMLTQRKLQITKDLEEAKRLHEEARGLLERYDAQLRSLDAERSQVLAEYRQMGETERDRIVADAQRQAEKIRTDAEQTVQNEIRKAREALEAEVVQIAVGMAEERLKERLDAGAQARLLDAYLEDLSRAEAR